MLRFAEVGNELNSLYGEGVRAHELNHFMERHNADLTFGASCDSCGREIEFLLFTCLGCRTRAICEPCYFLQLQEEDEASDSEEQLMNS